MTAHSATLAIDEAVAARREAGQDVLHLGFGEAGLPVPLVLTSVLAAAGERNSYGPVAGGIAAREAAAGWFSRRGLVTSADQIVFAPGSKPLLFALLAAIGGDVVLPRPSWVSYAAQAGLLGRNVLWVPVTHQAGGVPDPGLLEAALNQARQDGGSPSVMVLTIPDNPTGTVAPPEQVREVCEIAERHGLAIISDEIYAELSHDGTAPSPARYLPERTVVTTGLSKSLGLGGWRIGFARTPTSAWGTSLRRDLTAIASEVWSSLAAPMQAVAAYALGDPPEVTAHIAASRRLHSRVAGAVYERLVAAGAVCRAPRAAFYLYPDFGPLAEVLRGQGIATGTGLAKVLLDQHGIATLPGSAFGDADQALTLRVATSQLYGATSEQRWAALRAAEPESLPQITSALARLDAGLGALTGTESVLAT